MRGALAHSADRRTWALQFNLILSLQVQTKNKNIAVEKQDFKD
jgi:hypothetical protein